MEKKQIIQDFIPRGMRNRCGIANPCNYITIHETGNTNKGANAKMHANFIKSAAVGCIPVYEYEKLPKSKQANPVSWHYTVDDTYIIQHLPDNEVGFHAGDWSKGVGSKQSIGIEVCVNKDGDLLKAWKNAEWLTIYLVQKYKMSINSIKQHYFWSGKNCPELLRTGKPYSWDDFINKVIEGLQ